MLIDSRCIDAVSTMVRPSSSEGPGDFYYQAHDEVFRAVLAIHRRRDPVDIVTVNSELEARGTLEAVGGTEALAEMLEVVPSAANAEHYAGMVAQLSLQRRLIGAAADIQRLAWQRLSPDDARELPARVERLVFDVTQGSRIKGPRRLGDVLPEVWRRVHSDKKEGLIPTGFEELDLAIDGLMPQELVLIGARPNEGKTATCGGIARRIAARGVGVLYFTLEMADADVATGWVASESRVKARKVRFDPPTELDRQERSRLREAFERMNEMPIFLDSTASRTWADVASISRRYMAEHGVRVVVVDYVQRLRPHEKRRSKQEEVSEAAEGLKQLALDTGLVVIAAAQLSRPDPKVAKPRRPRMADLKESGVLEQEADKVILIHRPERSGLEFQPCLWIVDKNRRGEAPVDVPVIFDGPRARFLDPADIPPEDRSRMEREERERRAAARKPSKAKGEPEPEGDE